MKRIFLLLLLPAVAVTLSAQTDKIIVKLSGATANTTSYLPYTDLTGTAPYTTQKLVKAHVRAEADYFLIPQMELGLYLGYSPFVYSSGNISYASTALFYGLNMNYHVLNYEKNKFKLYVAGRFGAYSNFAPQGSDTNLEFGIGLGLGYMFNKHIGIFAEGLYGKFADSHWNWRAGVNYRF